MASKNPKDVKSKKNAVAIKKVDPALDARLVSPSREAASGSRSPHPKVETMIIEIMKSLSSNRAGVSLQMIKKTMLNNYPNISLDKLQPYIKKFMTKSLADGLVVNANPDKHGLVGKFKLNKDLLKEKVKLGKPKKNAVKSKTTAVTSKKNKPSMPSAEVPEEEELENEQDESDVEHEELDDPELSEEKSSSLEVSSDEEIEESDVSVPTKTKLTTPVLGKPVVKPKNARNKVIQPTKPSSSNNKSANDKHSAPAAASNVAEEEKVVVPKQKASVKDKKSKAVSSKPSAAKSSRPTRNNK